MTRIPGGFSSLRLFAIVSILLAPFLASSQITNVTEDQAPPIEGAGHDYIRMLSETVTPATGEVSVRIQVPVPQGRGFTIPFAFGYDSNVAFHIGGFSSAQTDLGSYLARGGWRYDVPQLTFAAKQYTKEFGNGNFSVCQYSTDYVLTDLQAAAHSLGLSVAQAQGQNNCSWYPNGGLYNFFVGGDAKVQATTSAWNYPLGTTSAAPVTVANMDGTVYYFSNSAGRLEQGGVPTVSSLPDWIEDRNGNEAVFTDSGNGKFTVTDTVGRTAISSSGFGVSGNTVTVSGLSGPYTATWGTVTPNYALNSVVVEFEPGTDGGCAPPVPTAANYPEITQITLPNGQFYKFQYDSATGLLHKLIYPTGAYARYVWGTNPSSEIMIYPARTDSNVGADCQAQYDTLAVAHRYVSFDGVHEVLQQDFTYSTTWPTPEANGYIGTWTSKRTTVVTHDLVRSTNFTTSYTYAGMAVPPQPNDPFWLGSSVSPVETQVVYYDTNGATLRTVQKSYTDPQLPPNETDILDNGQTSQTTYSFSSLFAGFWPSSVVNADGFAPCYQYGRETCLSVLNDKYEYDYGTAGSPGSPGPILKRTHFDYYTFGTDPLFSSPYSSVSSPPTILDRPSDIIIYDGNSNKMAETDYAYDGTGVSSVSSATGHDETNYSTSYNVRGNATTKTVKCLQTGCSNAVTTYTYDETGQPVTMTDPCGNGTCSDMSGTTHTTTYSFANSYTVLSGGSNVPYTPSGNTNAYLSKITDPLGLSSSFTYDYHNGQLTKSTDPNTQSTSYIYNDAFARPTLANFPDGGQTEAAYNDSAPSVTTCQLISGTAGATCSSTSPPTGWKTTLDSMDGLGHEVQSELVSDPDGPTFTATSYDGQGKTYQSWNPTRCSPPTTNCGTETTWGLTTFVYDALGRTKTVTKPDGSVATTSYSGNQTTVSDEIGNQRSSQVDALGRSTAVREAPNATGYNYETQYQYDALGNLLCAVQKGTDTTTFTNCGSASASWRPRSFIYDSLSRLTSATNPESGTITYAYDLNRNLLSRVAPKPGQTGTAKVTTNYSYDVLDRLTQKAYVGLSTSTVKFAYDGTSLSSCGQNPPTITSPTNLIGRRSGTCSGESGVSWSYDSMGRPLLESRINSTGGGTPKYSVGYTYNLDGSLSTLTYPSGDVLTYTSGGAGRPLGISDSSNTYVASGTSNRATYAPQGVLAGMTNGYTGTFAGIVTSNTYSDRLQPILMSASVSSSAIFSLCYDFHLGVAISTSSCTLPQSTTGDNGNVFQILNNVDSTRSTAYIYDPLNRIAQAHTLNTTSGNCWGETYSPTATAPGVLPSTPGIDTWGNLTNRSGVSGMGTCYTEGLSATATTQNQLSGIGMLYDAAGNVTNDGNGNTPTYDAENRIVTDAGVTYSYDADGLRTEKSSGTKYWFGPGGQVLTEASLSGTITEEYVYFNGERIARIDRPSRTVHYYFSNHLGSASVITDANGNVQDQADYYPFGGIAYNNGSDPNHYKFTGKERDAESNLDNFGARYFTSATGRFMTPDWAARPTAVPYALFGDPQSLNLYTYVRNDPVSRADADGHAPQDCTNPTGGKTSECREKPNSGAQNPGVKSRQDKAQNKSWWQKLAGIFYAKGSVGVALEVGVEAHIGKAKSPLKVGAKVGADVKSTMTVTTEGTSVSATKEAQAGVNIGKVILGPQTSTENVTVKNGEALANPGVEKSSSAMFGTERAEGTLSKGDFGVGAEIDAGVLVVGFEVGVDFDKVKDLFNPQ